MNIATAHQFNERKYYPMNTSTMDDPYPEYERVREFGPLCWVAPMALGISRYDDIIKMIKDPRIISSFPKNDTRFTLDQGPAAELSQHILLTREPQDHQRLRDLLNPAFSAKRIASLRERIREKVITIYETAADNGELDVVNDLGLPLTVTVVAELLGIPDEKRDQISQRVRILSRAFTPFAMPEEDREPAKQDLVWLRKLMRELLQQKRLEPREDLLSELAKALEAGNEFTEDELVDNAVFVLFTGYETTASLIGTGFSLLLENPQQKQKLWQNPELVKNAIQEMLRFDAPSQFAAGIAQEKIEFYDDIIRAGRVVFFMLGSGNRDPRKFDNPEMFDIGRQQNHHLSFGTGPHHCIGSALGMLESDILFSEIISMFRDIEPAGLAIRQLNPSIRSYRTVPVRVIPR